MITQIPAQIDEMMKNILHVRYSDPGLEKSLCLQLLQWEAHHNHLYIQAFALTYLGDCAIGMNEYAECIVYLKQARDVSVEQDYQDLLVRIYSLLGIYYDRISDEQSSLEYYIEGLSICHALHDAASEGLILNNIGYNLQRHQGYTQALKLYQEAYPLLQTCKDTSPSFCLLLNNLATVSILLDNPDEAKRYIMECEKETRNSEQYDLFRCQNWCQYYAYMKDEVKALEWADRVISCEAGQNRSKQDTFEIYSILFDSMIQLFNKAYAERFLTLMETKVIKNAAKLQQELEIQRMKYFVTFDVEEAILKEGYKRYAKQIQLSQASHNKAITDGLKDAIRFLHAAKQKEQLKNEKNDLAQQVNVDELTQVYTRHYLEILMNRFEREDYQHLAFVMIDVDCLKEYNDTYGHSNGDDVLHTVGGLLNNHKNERMYPCRFGGDEFVCLCMDCTNEEITTYIESIREDLYTKHIPHETSRCADEITLSIGYCNETKEINLHQVFELADQALYHSKIQGRNTYSKRIVMEVFV